MHRLKQFNLLSLCVLLSACGGSSSDSSTEPPVTSVYAGVDKVVDEKVEFELTATATPEGGEFTWIQQSGDVIEGFPLSGQTQTVMAPDIKQDQDFLFKVEYRLNSGTLVSDTVLYQMRSRNQLPVIKIAQTSPTSLPSVFGDTVTLSSSGSFDPDENGQIAKYQWQQTKGDPLTLTSGLNSSDISFTHPLLAQNSQVQFSLTLTDDEGGEQTNFYDLLLLKTNQVIVVNAGASQSKQEFEAVTLDGSQSQVVTSGFSCFWQQLLTNDTVTKITINNPNLCITQFVVPDIDGSEQLKIQLTVTDDENRSANGQTQITVKPKALGAINDSGMRDCYDNTSRLASCQNNDFPRQDAERGRDQFEGLLDKVGTGTGGFDFTKLDQFAGELPDSSTVFDCVRDNLTGLIWEVKDVSTGTLPTTSLREGQNRYSWFSSLDGNGGVDGVAVAPLTSCPSAVDCGLETYVEEVNAVNFCGGNNWRVPTHSELTSLLNYAQQGSGNLILSDFFPNTPSVTLNGHLRYWTIETSAEGAERNFAWAIDFATGNDIAYPKNELAYLRLVRNP